MIVVTNFIIKSLLMYMLFSLTWAKIRHVTTYYVGDVTTSDKPWKCNTTE